MQEPHDIVPMVATDGNAGVEASRSIMVRFRLFLASGTQLFFQLLLLIKGQMLACTRAHHEQQASPRNRQRLVVRSLFPPTRIFQDKLGFVNQAVVRVHVYEKAHNECICNKQHQSKNEAVVYQLVKEEKKGIGYLESRDIPTVSRLFGRTFKASWSAGQSAPVVLYSSSWCLFTCSHPICKVNYMSEYTFFSLLFRQSILGKGNTKFTCASAPRLPKC